MSSPFTISVSALPQPQKQRRKPRSHSPGCPPIQPYFQPWNPLSWNQPPYVQGRSPGFDRSCCCFHGAAYLHLWALELTRNLVRSSVQLICFKKTWQAFYSSQLSFFLLPLPVSEPQWAPSPFSTHAPEPQPKAEPKKKPKSKKLKDNITISCQFVRYI